MVHCPVVTPHPFLTVLILRLLSMWVFLLGLDTQCPKVRSQDKAYEQWHSKTPTGACLATQCWAGRWQGHWQHVSQVTLAKIQACSRPSFSRFLLPSVFPLLILTVTQTWLYQEDIDEEYIWSSKKSHLKGHLSCDHSHTHRSPSEFHTGKPHVMML